MDGWAWEVVEGKARVEVYSMFCRDYGLCLHGAGQES